MTDYQNELVMEHLDLVNWVIRTRISVPNRPLGLFKLVTLNDAISILYGLLVLVQSPYEA